MGPLAKGTPVWVWAAPIVVIISASLTFLIFGDLFLLSLHVIAVLFLAALLLFFRDPERTIGDGIVSPADGKVRAIERNGDRVTVSIFMNVHNVHVNRAPVDGTVRRVEHRSGGFVPAFKKGSDRNERVLTTLSGPHGRFEIVQIAGTVARRIVPYRSVGERLEKGDRIGLIRFGSRVDVTFDLPGGNIVKVKVGDRVRAGTTTIAGRTVVRGRDR